MFSDAFVRISQRFGDVRSYLMVNRGELTGTATTKQLRETESAVLTADLEAERRLVPALCQLWRNFAVLCEEAEHSELPQLVPEAHLLPYRDHVTTLPHSYMSVDGLDGSSLYKNGELSLTAISAGLIWNSKPYAGIVTMLEEGKPYHTGICGTAGVFLGRQPIEEIQEPKRPLNECLIGLDDNKAVDSVFRKLVIGKLTGSRGTRYPLNVPSVAGGIKVVRGNLAAYVTSNARNWDIAGTAALCEAAGLVARCLDGSPIPWNCVRMPPVVFARDEETFSYVQRQAVDWLDYVEQEKKERN